GICVPQCEIYIPHCGFCIPQCGTENSFWCLKENGLKKRGLRGVSGINPLYVENVGICVKISSLPQLGMPLYGYRRMGQ
ncbi:hypothetical protein, partial [Bacteroides mediterraneensis]|uniref:hypothetical protein n=1 Tax=Bacteroides mediterraneensis TaxID=1841856 RepID=UPI0026E93684